MLRFSRRLLQHHGDTEKMRSRRRARHMYNKDGSFSWFGFFKVLWVSKRHGFWMFTGGMTFFWCYTQLIAHLERGKEQVERQSEEDRVAWLKQSGKVKSDMYIALNRRQIDDPDIMVKNLPSFTGPTNGPASRLFTSDAHSSGPLQDERFRH